jgi:hypothetical protein
MNGKYPSRHEPSDEYIEAPARADECIQSDVSSSPRRVGEATTIWKYTPPRTFITNDAWIEALYRNIKSPSSRKATT